MTNFQKAGLVVFGVFVVILGIYAFSPLLYDKKVNENISDIGAGRNQPATTTREQAEANPAMPRETENTVETLKQGNFVGVGGHDAEGTGKILKSGGKYFVRLEDNFKATNGPDLFVYLGKDGKYDPAAEVGRLKGNMGGQNYEIPQNLSVNQYSELWIWCKAFSVEFGKAELE